MDKSTRRDTLRAVGAALVTGVAGCSGPSDGAGRAASRDRTGTSVPRTTRTDGRSSPTTDRQIRTDTPTPTESASVRSGRVSVEWSTVTDAPITSAPAVVDGVVYTGTKDGTVVAITRADGTTTWRRSVGGGESVEVAPHGQRVYVTVEGRLQALDIGSGAARWSVTVETDGLNRPVIDEGRVFVTGVNGRVGSFDSRTGNERWVEQLALGPDTMLGPGLTVTEGHVVGQVILKGAGLVALDARTGTKRWGRTLPGVSKHPAAVGGRLYVGTDRAVHAIEVTDGTSQWRTPLLLTDDRPPTFWTSPSVVDGTVYFGTVHGTIHALDGATGQESWRTYVPGEVTSVPAVVDGTVYVGTTDPGELPRTRRGFVHALNAATGKHRWTVELPKPVTTSPVVVEGVVCIGAGRILYALRDHTTA